VKRYPRSIRNMIIIPMRNSRKGRNRTNKRIHRQSILCRLRSLIPYLEYFLLVFRSLKLEVPCFVDGRDGLIETDYGFDVGDDGFAG
jgi:hypothetical protein